METITKKKFKDLHSTGKLRLIQGGIKDKTLSELKNAIDSLYYDYTTLPVSSIDVSSQGDYCNTTIYRYVPAKLNKILDKKVFYIVDTLIDSSKNNQCSWDTKNTYSTVYQTN